MTGLQSLVKLCDNLVNNNSLLGYKYYNLTLYKMTNIYTTSNSRHLQMTNLAKMMISIFDGVENIVGEREFTGYQGGRGTDRYILQPGYITGLIHRPQGQRNKGVPLYFFEMKFHRMFLTKPLSKQWTAE